MIKRLKIIFILITTLLFGCQANSLPETLSTTIPNHSKAFYETFVNTIQAIEDTINYRVYEQVFVRDGLKIYGQFVLPKEYTKPLPLVIIGHGFNSSYASNMVYAKFLANQGVASYAFDFIGGSSVSKSDGDMIDTSIISQRRDMVAVLQQLSDLKFIDTQNIFLMGDSQGGLVAALTAGQYPDLVKGLVLLYPALRLPNVLKLFENNLDKLPDTLTVMGGTIGKRYVSDAAGLNVNDEIAQFKGSVLIIQGDKDLIVPLSSSQDALAVYHNATLEVITGAGHGFDDQQLKRVLEKIADYIRKSSN